MSDLDFLYGDVVDCAKRLIGCYLVREIDGQIVKVKIVETEAYRQDDVASHSYNGITKRNQVMFGPPGYLYVYFTYGMHYCANVVVGPRGQASAVLLRGAEVIEGIDVVRGLRKVDSPVLLDGPAKLCQGLAIDKDLYGHDLTLAPLKLQIKPEVPAKSIVAGPRIGLSKGQSLQWRFYLKNNPNVSKSNK